VSTVNKELHIEPRSDGPHAQVVVELSRTKCIPILLYGLDACPVSSRQLRSLNYVVVSCARKICNTNSSEMAAECIKCLE